jgi:hypothetical protein
LVQWKLKNIFYFPFLLIPLEWIFSYPIKIQGHPTHLFPTINFKMKTNGLSILKQPSLLTSFEFFFPCWSLLLSFKKIN